MKKVLLSVALYVLTTLVLSVSSEDGAASPTARLLWTDKTSYLVGEPYLGIGILVANRLHEFPNPFGIDAVCRDAIHLQRGSNNDGVGNVQDGRNVAWFNS